jgi:putative thioredoxin
MSSVDTALIRDVGEADFERLVIERSRQVPVVVDFWAEWCAPCRALGPTLERAVQERKGAVELAKVDVDSNGGLAARYGVQGIPAVKAFRDGEVAGEFTGALPAPDVERFLDGLAPSEADQLAERAAAEGDEQGLRDALARDPRQAGAAVSLARLLLRRGDAAQEALEVLEPVVGTDFIAAGLAARARLELSDRAPHAAFEAWDGGDHERTLALLQEEVPAADSDLREELRKVMVAIFTELGPQSSLASEHRRRLAAALN